MQSINHQKHLWKDKITECGQKIASIHEKRAISKDQNDMLTYDDLGYDLVDLITEKTLYMIEDLHAERNSARVILRVKNLSEQYWNRAKQVRYIIKKMMREIKTLKLPNQIFVYNTLNGRFEEWQGRFADNGNIEEMRECRYMKMKCRMWCCWHLARSKRNVFFFLKFLGLFISWAAFGFGERPRNFIITAITIAFLFTIFFYIFPNCIYHDPSNFATNGFDKFIHLFLISVTIMTSFEVTNITPLNNWGQLIITLEIICGYVMFALLIPMVISRITER